MSEPHPRVARCGEVLFASSLPPILFRLPAHRWRNRFTLIQTSTFLGAPCRSPQAPLPPVFFFQPPLDRKNDSRQVFI
jgi:hypothetical protein